VPFTRVLSSKQGLVVVPPNKVGVKAPALRLRNHEAKLERPPKRSPVSKKKNPKKKLPDVLGTMRFQDGIRSVQGGLPGLGKHR
jgi:hypothetical protein